MTDDPGSTKAAVRFSIALKTAKCRHGYAAIPVQLKLFD